MIATIKAALISFTLFVSGGNVLSTNLKLHHYSDDDFKEIMNLKNKASISKNCTRHTEVEDIKRITHGGNNGAIETRYIITKNDVLEKVNKEESS